MRKIEKLMVKAIENNLPFRMDDTSVVQEIGHDLKNNGNAFVFLHGNMIAKIFPNRLEITLADWPTNTTRSRLHALCSAFTKSRGMSQSKHEQFLDLPTGKIKVSAKEWYSIPRVFGGLHA